MTALTAEDTFVRICEALGLSDNPGLVRRDAIQTKKRFGGWTRIMNKFGIDAVFFIQTEINMPSIPMIYFKKIEAFDEKKVAELHKQVWNQGKIPLLFIVLPGEVKIYNCFEPPQSKEDEIFDTQKRLIKYLKMFVEIEDIRRELSSFTYEKLCSGRFWLEKSELFDLNNRADVYLLNNLRSLRKVLKSKGLDDKYVHRLIARSVLVLCLEDRGVLKEFYKNFMANQYSSFRAIENKEHAYELFQKIGQHLNGDIFPITEEETKAVSEKHFGILRLFLLGTNPENGQTRLWPYRFDIIPIEFISSIYEEFFHRENISSDSSTMQSENLGTYYTPQSLVSFILDDVIGWKTGIQYPRILDPSCGSGIFLVEAYRKIIDQTMGDRDDITASDLRKILQNSIFGIDVNREAVGITAFSLYLTMLDYVSADSLWQLPKLFPKLIDFNLFACDFFDTFAQFNKMEFDYVIGNVPWLTVSEKSKTKALRYCLLNHRPIGDRQIAQAFVWKALDMANENGEICLIIGAKSLLFNRSDKNKAFRKELLKVAKVKTIINLAILRHSLFSRSMGPAAIIHYGRTRSPTDDGAIGYICPKTSLEAKYVGAIVIDKSDYSIIPLKLALNDDFAWKIAMWGTPRDLRLINRIREAGTLGKIAEKQKWRIGDGFQKKGSGHRRTATWLLSYPYLPAKSLAKYEVKMEDTEPITDPVFRRPKTRERFTAPMCLTKVTLKNGDLVSAFSDFDIAFTDGIIGISASPQDSDLLKILCCFLNSKIAKYLLFLTCSVWGVERDDILKDDLQNLPIAFPERGSAAYSSLLDIYSNITGLMKLGDVDKCKLKECEDSINDIFSKFLNLDEIDKKLIEDTVYYTIDFFQKKNNSIATKTVSENQLRSYADLSLSLLNSFVIDSKKRFTSRIYAGNSSLKAVSFELRDEHKPTEVAKNTESLQEALNEAFSRLKDKRKEVVLRKIMRVYDGKNIFIIKPNEQRYWTGIEAYRDSDEIIVEILEVWRENNSVQGDTLA